MVAYVEHHARVSVRMHISGVDPFDKAHRSNCLHTLVKHLQAVCIRALQGCTMAGHLDLSRSKPGFKCARRSGHGSEADGTTYASGQQHVVNQHR